MGCTRHKS